MTYKLTSNSDGGTFTWEDQEWKAVFQLGIEFGWDPEGTESYVGELHDTYLDESWDGNYHGKHSQIVSESDAKNWAAALRKAGSFVFHKYTIGEESFPSPTSYQSDPGSKEGMAYSFLSGLYQNTHLRTMAFWMGFPYGLPSILTYFAEEFKEGEHSKLYAFVLFLEKGEFSIS